jgi:SAM-dependent methyltransferase
MNLMDMSKSYGGISAYAWDWMGGDEIQADLPFYSRKIQDVGGKALDLACGTGRHLLRYLHQGLDVEGVDTSEGMLARLREKADAQGLRPTVYRQSMESFDLPHKYRTIFISGGSFQLLWQRHDALQALRRCFDHLEPGGRLFVETFIPSEAWNLDLNQRLGEENTGEVSVWGPTPLPSGETVTTHVWLDSIDRFKQVKTDKRRYELRRAGELISTELHTLRLRWYFTHELTMMLESAGFANVFIHGDYSDNPANAQSNETIYVATRP